ncbi:natriuretic peptides A-like [Zootoca vivipara]|uniref:natriuretic peptides A-like n=1 Tax=Zootoca vivipara TaxID=8524 RepID=UPI001591CAD2|nr:natriuretic peptides A-like [Zootoca vivipara]
MDAVAWCRWSSVFLVFAQAGMGLSNPVAWSPSSEELRSLQDLLERLKEKFPEGELEAPISRSDEADDGSDVDLVDAETLSSSQLRLQTAEVEDHWMKFLASPKRRRYFSGCFGTRLERIGTQTGLGCNVYRARSWRKPRS